jgi:DNA processing protein
VSDARLRLAFAGMHPDRARELRERFGGAGGALRAIEGRSVRASDQVRAAAQIDAATRRGQVERLGIEAVLRGDPDYPAHLDRYEDAPDVLFVRGTLSPLPGVAIVGTRTCTSYGRELARAYGAAVANVGWPVISGLARGIDGEAHRGVIDAGGVGVAILGCGIDVAYPREHEQLGRQLLGGGGAIVTEYPPGSPPDAWRFPARNRIIAGLSAAVVVVEAARTGGALITAMRAAEYGIPVFAVPGDVDRSSSEGCNRLIRDGAFPVLDPDDLIEELGLVHGLASSADSFRA